MWDALKTSCLVGAVIMLGAVGSVHAQADADWDRYKATTMRELRAESSLAISDIDAKAPPSRKKTFYVSFKERPSKVLLKFSGHFRPIDSDRMIVIRNRLNLASAKGRSPYNLEAAFKEGNTTYWIPIQDVLLDDLRQIRPGTVLLCFVKPIAAIRRAGVLEWVVPMMAFAEL